MKHGSWIYLMWWKLFFHSFFIRPCLGFHSWYWMLKVHCLAVSIKPSKSERRCWLLVQNVTFKWAETWNIESVSIYKILREITSFHAILWMCTFVLFHCSKIDFLRLSHHAASAGKAGSACCHGAAWMLCPDKHCPVTLGSERCCCLDRPANMQTRVRVSTSVWVFLPP